MNYLLKSKPKSNSKKILGLIVLIIAVLFLGTYLFLPTIQSFSHTTALPVWTFRNYTTNSLATLFGSFRTKLSLVEENKSLKEQLESLNLKQLDYDVLLKENQDLKDLLGRPYLQNKIITRIVSKPPRSPYDTFIVDAGSSSGISENRLVYISGNIIVGKVSSAMNHSSIVTLFSTNGVRQQAILERTGAMYELVGKGGANFSIELPKDADILWGDVFLYPTINSSIIGNVYYIDTNSQSAFKTVFVRVPGNVFESKWLFVEKDK